jgi:hypothetical protein
MTQDLVKTDHSAQDNNSREVTDPRERRRDQVRLNIVNLVITFQCIQFSILKPRSMEEGIRMVGWCRAGGLWQVIRSLSSGMGTIKHFSWLCEFKILLVF